MLYVASCPFRSALHCFFFLFGNKNLLSIFEQFVSDPMVGASPLGLEWNSWSRLLLQVQGMPFLPVADSSALGMLDLVPTPLAMLFVYTDQLHIDTTASIYSHMYVVYSDQLFIDTNTRTTILTTRMRYTLLYCL